jgi:phospholipase C
MIRLSRSRFLSATAAAAALPLVEWVRPACAQASPAKLSDIDHIVILMQENRSFDHYFGTLSGVRGFDDPRAALLPDGRPVFYQPSPVSRDGYVLPFHLDTKTTSAQQLHDLSHAWRTLHDSWNAGRQDGFVTAHFRSDGASGSLTMGYYRRDDIPFHYALADAFAICDGYHASVMGPTNPNRYYWMTASIDPDGKNGGPATNNRGRRYSWETYPERLERAGISWRIYRPEITAEYPVGLDVIMNFAAFQDAPKTSPLYENAARQRSVESMLQDMRTGNLPQVTWIVPPYDVCEHPDMLPAAGEDYVRRILEALWSNAALWSRTAFVIVYDENDGLFDHVVPPTPSPGTPGEFIDGVPIGLGFRVPCLVISPFSRGGFVCSSTFDHTSTLRLIEARFGVEIPYLTPWRRETCGDLTAAFGFGEPADSSVPALPSTADALRLVEQQIRTLPPPSAPAIQATPKPERAAFVRRRRQIAKVTSDSDWARFPTRA